MIGYRFMPLFKDPPHDYLKWQDRHNWWGHSWKATVNHSVVLEPRWIRGRLVWLYQNDFQGKHRWLIELFENGEPDFQLKQAMHAARWVEEHKKKGQKHERANPQ